MKTLPTLLVSILLASPFACQACWQAAGAKYGVDPNLLSAIGMVESGMNPSAVNRTHFRRTRTVDIGLMQINASKRVMANLGLTEKDLFDPCINIHTGARILDEKFARHGVTWEAIGAYNASCTTLSKAQCRNVRSRYAWRVYRALNGRDAEPIPAAWALSKHKRRATRQRAVERNPDIIMVGLS